MIKCTINAFSNMCSSFSVASRNWFSLATLDLGLACTVQPYVQLLPSQWFLDSSVLTTLATLLVTIIYRVNRISETGRNYVQQMLRCYGSWQGYLHHSMWCCTGSHDRMPQSFCPGDPARLYGLWSCQTRWRRNGIQKGRPHHCSC